MDVGWQVNRIIFENGVGLAQFVSSCTRPQPETPLAPKTRATKSFETEDGMLSVGRFNQLFKKRPMAICIYWKMRILNILQQMRLRIYRIARLLY